MSSIDQSPLSHCLLESVASPSKSSTSASCRYYSIVSTVTRSMASSSVRDSSSLPSQYHHFVPRFILKNFAVFKNPGTIKPRTGRGNKRPAPLPSRLNLLAFDTGSLIQEDVAHTFGFVDMYRDVSLLASDPFDLEKRLSRLESDVGRIISDIKRAHDSGRSAVQLKRPEKDLLRRFLFIMLYRNRTLAGRYEKATDEYDANDKEVMLAYMREHGFSRPRDVWFSNIRAFLEVDLSGEWHQWYPELIRRAYPSDVEWFFKNMQCSYLAFCTPENANDEFILTPNAYSIFEGPQSPSGAWTDYHIFAPISPRLLMVTRSYLLPGGLEGEAGEDERLAMLEMSKSMHLNPSAANSCLEDLPIAKANNNYTRLVDGNLVPLATKISREKHIFYFKFFSIKAEHVQKINMIFLEEALGTTSLVYKSPSALRLALEYYLTSQVPGFKQVVRKPHARTQDYVPQLNGEMLDTRNEENRLPYLHLLEKIARCLGSNATAEYTMIGPFPVNDAYQVNPKFREIHCKIGTDARLVAGISWLIFIAGGNSSTLMTDFRQAELVMRLIGITDRIMRASDDRSKDIIRKHREDLISSLPPRRVWLLAKIMKSWSNRKLNAQARKLSNWSQVSFEGIEDALAEGYAILPSLGSPHTKLE